MKLATVQYTPPWGQPQVARRQLLALVREAAVQGANIIVCPEMAVSGYVFDSVEEKIFSIVAQYIFRGGWD